ncbi:hypothetical protein [Rothia nasimurium]|uniref:hypothetical protein n=1 Tax=Rothia nasimurium TaxID=85336 RepID=UPI002DD62BC5|nr:hypothetical protein [Rothia nasimurium]
MYVGAAKFHWGTVPNQTNQRQQLLLFSRLRIQNVSVGSITSVKVDYVIQQRADGTTRPGAPLATAAGSDFVNGRTYFGTQTGLTTKGATGILTQTATDQTVYFGTSGSTAVYDPASTSGTPYTTYTLSYELSNFSDAYYTAGSNDCNAVFDTGNGDLNSLQNLGSAIEINWTGQRSPSSLSADDLHIAAHWTYTLADGRTYEVVQSVLPTQPALNTNYFASTGW